jgi:hypothetical protein
MDKEFILSKPKGRANSTYIKKNYLDEYEIILGYPGKTFPEKLYNYFYGNPLHICPICGKDTPFRSITYGYSEFCSVKCSYQSKNRVKKIKKTCLERYGVSNPSKSKEIQKKKEETCLKNYGVRCGLQLQDKFEKTCLERYGVSNPSKSKEIQKKKEETCLKNYGVKYGILTTQSKQSILNKYGVEHISQSEEIKAKKQKTWRNNFLSKHDIHIGFDINGNWICKCPYNNCNKCEEKQFIIPQQVYNDRKRNRSEICTKLLPIGKTNQGTTLELFIQSILDKHNIEYKTNYRGIISPKELDIYIPSKNIAIECNGVYWHSLKEPLYHFNKYKECDEKGVQLLTIWEDWFKTKPQIIESVIKSKLGLIDSKLYARKCIIKDIDSNTCKNFLNNNHIQGFSPSTIKIGLYYNDELVSVMTFSKSRAGIGKKEDGYELVRFCNKLNINVVGAASKLLKYFILTYNPNKIVSYSSNDISNGNLYSKLDFIKDSKQSASYWYINQNTFQRYHRYNFRKTKLKELGYDISKTETEIMKELPYWKIYDSGTTRWVWSRES